MADTKNELMRRLLEGPATASDLAKAQGISSTAARRHMEDLADEDAVASFFRQEGVGRPSKFYELTEKGRERFPRRYDVAAKLLMSVLEDQEGTEGLEAAMDQAGRALAEDLSEDPPLEAPLEDRVKRVREMLEDLGFPTELEEHGDRWVLVRRDCIFHKLAHQHRDAVCGRFDTTLLESLLGEDVELEGCLPDGRSSCRHVIER